MKKEVLKKIIKFLEEKENNNPPFIWKLKNDIPLIKEDLDVKGNLDLSYTNITFLPEGLEVGGDLYLYNCKNIESLPEGLKVGGNLYLSYTNITSLPEGLEVGFTLFLHHSKIESLPKGLKVGGALDTRYTKLKKYTDKELLDMVKPGFIKGKIWR